MGLDEKLDLADTAAPQLDVMAQHTLFTHLAVNVDLALHGLNIGDHREVEMFAPDEGREFL